jgi:hypothetical protein
MNDRFKQLYDEIVGPPQPSYERLQAMIRELRGMGNISDELLEALEEQYSLKNWGGLFRLFGILYSSPDKRYIPILCEMLDAHKDKGIAENVVDILDVIQDERSVPCLARSIDYYEPGDEDRYLNRKVIYALSRIGTPEAVEAIRGARENEDENIRTAAIEELSKHRQ